MKKNPFLILAAFFAVNAFAVPSLDFGGAGVHLDAKLMVYADETAGTPKCRNCVRFSVMVDDVTMGVGTPYIGEVIVLVRHPELESTGLFEPYIYRFTVLNPVFRSPGSPRSTEQFELTIPVGRGSRSVEKAEFEVIALRKRNLNPTMSPSNEDVMDVIAKFNGADVKSLDPIKPTKLATP